MLVQAIRVVLITLDVVFAVWLVAAPPSGFEANPVWREAARLIPFHSFDLLGFAFLVGPVLAAGSALYSTTHRLGRLAYAGAGIALGITGACWGLTGVSFARAALELADGQGWGSVILATALVALHGLLAFERHPKRQVDEQVRHRLNGA
jgi:sugar phosphate permease